MDVLPDSNMSHLHLFLASFKREHSTLFNYIKETLATIEENYMKKNKDEQLDLPNNAEDVSPLRSHSSSTSIFRTSGFSKYKRSGSNCNEFTSTEASTGSLGDLDAKPTQSIVPPLLIASSADSFRHISRRDAHFKTILIQRSSHTDIKPIAEAPDSPTPKAARRRMPFFALNIKAVRIADSPIGVPKTGISIREHSPMLQPKRSVNLDRFTFDLSTARESPSPMGRSKIHSVSSPNLSRCGSEKIQTNLTLDDHLLEESFLKSIREIEGRSSTRRQLFREILEHIFGHKNLDESFYRNYPRNEVIYCVEVDARYFLDSLQSLIETLNSEDPRTKMQIIDDIQYLQTQLDRFLRVLSCSVDYIRILKRKINIDESEIRGLYARIVKVSQNLHRKCKSRICVRENIHTLQKLIERFPPTHIGSNDRAPLDPQIEIKFITVRKLVEKVSEVLNTTLAERLKLVTIFTYDHFMHPLTLLLLLIKKYYTPRPIMMTHTEYIRFKTHHSDTRRKRIIELLRFWIDHRPNDFIGDSDLLGLLVTFLDSIFKFEKEDATEKDFLELFDNMEQLIEKSKAQDKKALIKPISRRANRTQTLLNLRRRKNDGRGIRFAEGSLRGSQKGSEINSERGSDRESDKGSEKGSVFGSERGSVDGDSYRRTLLPPKPSNFRSARNKPPPQSDQERILGWDANEMAIQLTLIDQKLFRKIQISHMMLKRWTNPECAEQCKDVHRAIKRFNSVSFWIQYVIVEAETWNDRFLLLNKFIAVARQCLKIQNYTTANSIFSALFKLQMSKIWVISKNAQDDWNKLLKTFRNENFFQDMDKVFHGLHPPAVPSISFFTKMFFRFQDNVTFLIKLDNPNKYLKCSQLYKLAGYCSLVRKFQENPYEFQKNEEMYNFLKKEYKMKSEINFDDDETEETLREKILSLTSRASSDKLHKPDDFVFNL